MLSAGATRPVRRKCGDARRRVKGALQPDAPAVAPRYHPQSVTSVRYIAVAGNIGAGKSSLVRWLCGQYSLEPFYEPHAENPYLEDFYKDMRRWGFSSQLFFLVNRFKHHKLLEGAARPAVQDRTIYEDAEIFAAHLHNGGLIDDRDWATYTDLYQTLRTSLRPPDLMIYLRCPMRVLRQRIRERGRSYEQSIPTAYLQSLERLYEEWFERFSLSPKLVLETDRLDYVSRLFDRQELLRTIDGHLGARGTLPGLG